eukprot:5468640-Pyramimonas_sp.AAC.1
MGMISASPDFTRPGGRDGERERDPRSSLIRLWHLGQLGLVGSSLSLYSHVPQPRQRVHARMGAMSEFPTSHLWLTFKAAGCPAAVAKFPKRLAKALVRLGQCKMRPEHKMA